MNYPVGDFLIQIKNAAMANNHKVVVDNTKLIKAVADALNRLGYLDEVVLVDGKLTVNLTYKRKQPILMNLKLVSKPGLRIYKSVDDLEKKQGPSIFVLSTPSGVLSQKEAIQKRAGGEVIVEIW
jgi:small subunit ribosomal protein S8